MIWRSSGVTLPRRDWFTASGACFLIKSTALRIGCKPLFGWLNNWASAERAMDKTALLKILMAKNLIIVRDTHRHERASRVASGIRRVPVANSRPAGGEQFWQM